MEASLTTPTETNNGFFSNFKTKHPKATKAIVTTGKVIGFVVAAAATAAAVTTVTFVAFNKPSVGKHCHRAHLTKYGIPKVGYKSPQRANFQVLKDAVLHNTIMHPYKCCSCGNYHVGHKH